MGRACLCVCGRLATKPLPKGIDALYVKGHGFKEHHRVCEECYRRIERLDKRFKPSFGGSVAVTVVYDPESRIYTIRSFNEYGDSAYLSEDMGKTRSFVRDLWTREIVILDDGEFVGVV